MVERVGVRAEAEALEQTVRLLDDVAPDGGAILIGNVFTGLQTPIGWLGVILLVTGLFGVCPVYSILGINTKSLGEKAGLK